MAGIMTILEANVPEEDWPALTAAWQQMALKRPPQMEHTWLLQGMDGSDTWCVLEVWPSMAAFDEYRGSVKAPAAVEMFRAVSADPALAVLEIMTESGHAAAREGARAGAGASGEGGG